MSPSAQPSRSGHASALVVDAATSALRRADAQATDHSGRGFTDSSSLVLQQALQRVSRVAVAAAPRHHADAYTDSIRTAGFWSNIDWASALVSSTGTGCRIRPYGPRS